MTFDLFLQLVGAAALTGIISRGIDKLEGM